MNTYKKITDAFVRAVSVVLMALIAAIVGVILYELFLRNCLNKSFRATTELCGLLFMWMAFLGVVVLYDQDRLITLDMMYGKLSPALQAVCWFANKLFSLSLGVVMVVAYQGMYQINSTSHFSAMPFLSKAWNFFPMAVAGGFMVVKTVYQLLDRIGQMRRGRQKGRGI